MPLESGDRQPDPHARALERLRRISHGEYLHHMALRVLIAILLLWCGLAWAQPTVGSYCMVIGPDNGTSVSTSCTAAGVNRWVGIWVTQSPKTDTVSSMSYGAQTPTPIT